jgi:hypothetical protein
MQSELGQYAVATSPPPAPLSSPDRRPRNPHPALALGIIPIPRTGRSVTARRPLEVAQTVIPSPIAATRRCD